MTRRGERGAWHFKNFENGKEHWISTGTTEKAEAEKFMAAHIDGARKVDALADTGVNIQQATQALVKSFVREVKGHENSEGLSFDDAYKKWLAAEPSMATNSEDHQGYIKSVFDKFAAWCVDKGINTFDSVTKENATAYAAIVRKDSFTPRTFNGHQTSVDLSS